MQKALEKATHNIWFSPCFLWVLFFWIFCGKVKWMWVSIVVVVPRLPMIAFCGPHIKRWVKGLRDGWVACGTKRPRVHLWACTGRSSRVARARDFDFFSHIISLVKSWHQLTAALCFARPQDPRSRPFHVQKCVAYKQASAPKSHLSFSWILRGVARVLACFFNCHFDSCFSFWCYLLPCMLSSFS